MKRPIEIIIFIFLISHSVFGQQTQFQKIYSGDTIPVYPSVMPNLGLSVNNTSDNGYIIGGMHGYYAGFYYFYGAVLKLNSNGDTLWTCNFGDGSTSSTTIYSIKENSDGSYIATGNTNSQLLLLKLSDTGNLLWAKTYGANSYGKDILQTNDGGFIIAGGTQNIGAGLSDSYFIKTDTNGDTLWTRVIGGAKNDYAQFIKQTSDNGFIAVGNSYSYDTTYSRPFILKLDSSGNLEWTKIYSVPSLYVSCTTTQNDTVVIASSSSNSKYLLTKLTPNCDSIIWAKTTGTGGDNIPFDMKGTDDNGFVVAGYTLGGPPGVPNMYLVKTNSNGDTLWTKAYGESGGDEAYSIVQSNDGGFALTGITHILNILQEVQIYFVKTNANGESGCHTYATTSYIGNAVTQTLNFYPQVTYGANPANTTLIARNKTKINSECFVVGINDLSTSNHFIIYPNPATQKATIEFENTQIEKYVLRLWNYQGILLSEKTFYAQNRIEIERMNLSNGIYFFQLISNKKQVTSGKIIFE